MTITVGDELVLSNITTDAYDSTPLTSTTALIVDGNYAEVISVSGLTPTENAKTQYSEIVIYEMSRVIALDSTNAVAIVQTSGVLRATHLTISGTIVSSYPQQNLFINTNGFDISPLSSSSFLLAYNNSSTGGGEAVVISVSSGTFTVNTAVQFTDTANLGSMSCSAYGALEAVVSWAEASPGAGYACFLSITGTTVSISVPKFSYEPGNVDSITVEWVDSSKAITAYRLTSTGYTWAAILQTSGAGTAFKFSQTANVTAAPSGLLSVSTSRAIALTGDASELDISGSTITLGDTQSVSGATAPLSLSKLSSTSALCVYDVAATKVKVIQFTVPTASSSSKILSLSIPLLGGSYIWATTWKDDVLYLLQFDKTTGMFLAEVSVGGATEAELNANTYVAYVYALNDNYIYVYGRMDNPYSLGSPVHVMVTSDGGSSWGVVESSWGDDYCAGLTGNASGDIFAVRCGTSNTLLYGGNALGISFLSSLPFTGDIEHGGISMSSDGDVIIASNSSDVMQIVRFQPPYNTAIDITKNHGTTGTKRVDTT